MKSHYILAGAVALSLFASGANAQELIANGGFESGDFTSWTITNQTGGSGNFFVQNYGATTPITGSATPVQAGGGSFFAVTDQNGPGSHTISQSFNALAGGVFTLSFDGWANDQSGAGPAGTGIDFNTIPNQHFQVNLNGNLIYSGILTGQWTNYVFDVSSSILNGGNTLSFSEVDNQFFFNVGLDNISLNSAISAVPEPSAWAMMLLGFGAIGVAMRRRRRPNLLQAA